MDVSGYKSKGKGFGPARNLQIRKKKHFNF